MRLTIAPSEPTTLQRGEGQEPGSGWPSSAPCPGLRSTCCLRTTTRRHGRGALDDGRLERGVEDLSGSDSATLADSLRGNSAGYRAATFCLRLLEYGLSLLSDDGKSRK
jgi:hypothetical protein